MIPPKPTDKPTLPTAPDAAPASPRPSRRTVVLVAVWTLLVAGVSSGVTAAVVGGSGGSGDIEDAAAPAVSPSIWQDTRTYPADPPPETEAVPSPSPTAKGFAMGEKAKSGGATVIVKKLSESASVILDDYESDKTLKAGTGAKFAIVETTVHNDGTEPFDPVCGGGISLGLIDAEGRKFDVINDVYLVKANRKAEACGEELQPGFKRDAVFVYKLPADASPAQWTFSGSRGTVEGDLAVVSLAGSKSS
ncbi:DUF4352 domain-containing protein [Streptomyces sp. NPDC018338]|uniref:DUF4352 domain-containing protein n=1 Tax=Streptomyces sp. NPDC018338 TaxID=3157192 RepID=UPI0033EDFB10